MSQSIRQLIILFLVGVCIVSVYQVMQIRQQARELTDQLSQLHRQARAYEDIYRSTYLEYLTYTNYEMVLQEAYKQGMVKPSLADGNLVYLVNNEKP